MKNYIVKRLKDGVHLLISERELSGVMNRESWDGMQFKKEFQLIGEDKYDEAEIEKLFDEK